MTRLRGQTIVATLIVIAIICMLAVVLLMGSGAFSKGGAKSSREDGLGKTTVGAVKYEAKDEVCKSNLKQCRSAIMMASTTDDAFPSSIQDLRIGDSFYSCPIGNEPYNYNPTDGAINCPHPGHESY